MFNVLNKRNTGKLKQKIPPFVLKFFFLHIICSNFVEVRYDGLNICFDSKGSEVGFPPSQDMKAKENLQERVIFKSDAQVKH